jgi:GAF domain-containing protein
MKPRRRYVVRRSPRPPGEPLPGQRELLAVREVVHAFLGADRPQEAFQFALDRVGPVVGAAFASVYLIEGASELMRLVAAYNWPEQHRPWLADVRVRVGFGPSGEAASERRTIEVPDVFADPGLEDWQEVARELDFRALVSLPLQAGPVSLGAVTFYFRSWDDFTVERRDLLRLVADLMAAAAEKSRLLDRARRAEAGVVEALTELDRQYVAVAGARRAGWEVVELALAVVQDALGALDAAEGAGPTAGRSLLARREAVRSALADLQLLADVAEERVALDVTPLDPRTPLRDALGEAVPADAGVHVVAEEPTHALPPIRTDRRFLALLLAKLVTRAIASPEGPEARIRLAVTGARVEYDLPGRPGKDVEWRLADALAVALGGAVEAREHEGLGRLVVTLPLEGPRRRDPGTPE